MTPEHTAEIIALLREIRNEQRAGFIRLELAIKALAPSEPDTNHTSPADDSSPELTDRERRILVVVEDNPGCSLMRVRNEVNGNAAHLSGELSSLVERGYLEYADPGRRLRYRSGSRPLPDADAGTPIDFTKADPPKNGAEWARKVRERLATRSHSPEEVADTLGVELSVAEGEK